MKVIPKYLTLLLLLFISEVYSVQTHCQEDESILINCRIKNSSKVLSFCGNKTDTFGYGKYKNPSDQITLQYRFGRLDHIELNYPEKKKDSFDKFKEFHMYSREVQYREIGIEFSISKNRYFISTMFVFTKELENWPDVRVTSGNKEIGFDIEESGISVRTSKGAHVKLMCDMNDGNYINNVRHLSGVLKPVNY